MKILLILLLCGFAAEAAFAENMNDPAGVRKNNIAAIFAEMRAKTDWNLEGDMLWGFFFTNPTKEPLAPFAKQLEQKGYRTVDIYLDDAKENWWLHVEKVEIHSVDSLYERESELRQLASKSGLGSYDGWDVGPVIKKKKG